VKAGVQSVQVSQAACTYDVLPERHEISIFGGSGAFEVRTRPGCPWSVRSLDTWILLTPFESSGPATIKFEVQRAGAPREGTIVAAGRKVVVIQTRSLDVR
jgi:hypothetical protein